MTFCHVFITTNDFRFNCCNTSCFSSLPQCNTIILIVSLKRSRYTQGEWNLFIWVDRFSVFFFFFHYTYFNHIYYCVLICATAYIVYACVYSKHGFIPSCLARLEIGIHSNFDYFFLIYDEIFELDKRKGYQMEKKKPVPTLHMK